MNNFISKLSDYKKERYGELVVVNAWCRLIKYSTRNNWIVDYSIILYKDKLKNWFSDRDNNELHYLNAAEILFKEGIYQEDPIIKVVGGGFNETMEAITFITLALDGNGDKLRKANMKINEKLQSLVMQDRAKRGTIRNYIESLKQQGILRDDKGDIVK